MKNLAGNTDADIYCAAELTAAGIEIAILPEQVRGEVPTRVTGKIGGITLRRAWRYWVAEGRVPLDVARRLYADPVGAMDVRVAGHCACPAPGEPGGQPDWFDGDAEVVIDPSGLQEAEIDALIQRGRLGADKKPRFAPSTDGLAGFVMLYHIDSAAGLRLFADSVR